MLLPEGSCPWEEERARLLDASQTPARCANIIAACGRRSTAETQRRYQNMEKLTKSATWGIEIPADRATPQLARLPSALDCWEEENKHRRERGLRWRILPARQRYS